MGRGSPITISFLGFSELHACSTHGTHLGGNFEITCWRALFFSGHSVNFLPRTSPKLGDVPKIRGRPLGTSPKLGDVPRGRPLNLGTSLGLCDVMNTNWGVGSFVNKTCRHQLSEVGSFVNKTCRHQLSWITVTSYDVMKRLFSRIHYE